MILLINYLRITIILRSTGTTILIIKSNVYVLPSLTADIVTWLFDITVGIPDITPVDVFKVNPVGKVPDDI